MMFHIVFQHANTRGPFWNIRPMRQASQPGSCIYQNARMRMGALILSSVTQLPDNVGVWTTRVMSFLVPDPHLMYSHLVKVHNPVTSNEHDRCPV
jgi:hypothetical protein